jgi:hypothetical protein
VGRPREIEVRSHQLHLVSVLKHPRDQLHTISKAEQERCKPYLCF